MKKRLKKITMMLIVLSSLFTMFICENKSVSALDTSATYPITQYLKGTTQDLDTTNLNWFDGSYSDYETYLFDFDTSVNDLVKEIKNIKVRYQTCKFNVGGKCWVYSDYKTYTISSDYYYNSFSGGYFADNKEFKQQNLGILSATGSIKEYEMQAFKYYQGYLKDGILEGKYESYSRVYHEEYTTFDEYYNLLDEMRSELSKNWSAQLSADISTLDMHLEDGSFLANLFVDGYPNESESKSGITDNYNIKLMLNDLDSYDWYFIMPVEETIYNLVINAEVINHDGTEWTMNINSVLNNQKGENPIANFIEKFIAFVEKIIDFFKNNTWAIYVLLFILAYPIIQIIISVVRILIKLIMIPINIIINIFDGINERSREKRRRKREEREYIENYENRRSRRNEEKYIVNTQYNDNKLRKYRRYK